MCFGSPSLLAYEAIDQAITSFDIELQTFTFMDRGDTSLKLPELRKQIVSAGLVYPNCQYKDSQEACLLWHLEHGISLSSDRKLVTVSGDAIMIEHIGKSLNLLISFRM